MAVKIRLMRIGAKKRPFYRVVAVDEKKKRTGQYLELLGTYNPLTEPKEILLKQDRIDAWIKQGAQPSTGFLRIIGKAPQRPPRKPKKQKIEQPAPAAESGKEKAAEAEGGTTDVDSQLSEASETRPESTSPDVHEEDQAGDEQSESAELENQNQASDQGDKPENEEAEEPIQEKTTEEK